jgi:hypothetical protein
MLDQHDRRSSAACPGGEFLNHAQNLTPVVLESLDQTLLDVNDDQSRHVPHGWRLLSFRGHLAAQSMPRSSGAGSALTGRFRRH